MNKTTSGFTIVELLIVIVVIAILASISVAAFNGVQTRAKNTARFHEINAWKKQFELYRAQEGNLPILANGQYCLGLGFPIGGGGVARCRDYEVADPNYGVPESGNSALMTELSKVGSLPSGNRKPFSATIGPYVTYTTSFIYLTVVLKGSNASECPNEMTYGWTDGTERLLCNYIVNK